MKYSSNDDAEIFNGFVCNQFNIETAMIRTRNIINKAHIHIQCTQSGHNKAGFQISQNAEKIKKNELKSKINFFNQILKLLRVFKHGTKIT